jgi:HD-GYP domain-containing protein (c-di-GMP phosphodiesterase class II)
MDVMRQHTSRGYQLAKNSLPAAAAQIILNHHQRWDGKGYPHRGNPESGEILPPLSERQIPVFSRIATVADVYDAATSARCYSPAKPPIEALYEMRTRFTGAFDPVVMRAFYRTVPPFPIGQVVTLSNGVEAAVIDFNPDDPARPKVRGLRTPDGQRFDHPSLEEIDLSLYVDLEIATIDGRDVRAWTAAMQPAEADESEFIECLAESDA